MGHAKRLIVAGLVPLMACCLCAGDWRGFNGAEKQGRDDWAGGPLEWSPSKNVVWKTAIPGRGHSSPIVSGNAVYVTTTYEAPNLTYSIWNYIVSGAALLFVVTGIISAVQSLRVGCRPVRKTLQHLRFFLSIQILTGVTVVALFGRRLLDLDKSDTRSLLVSIVMMLCCLLLVALSTLLKSDRHLNAGEDVSGLWTFGATGGAGFIAGLIPFLLLIYRGAGYRIPDSYVWDSRLQPNADWWFAGLCGLAALAAVAVGCRRLTPGGHLPRFSMKKVFLAVSVVLGITFFIQANLVDKGDEFLRALICLDGKSGAMLWKCEGLTGKAKGTTRTVTYASATPITDGERIFAYFGEDGLMCVSPNGRLLWKKTEPMFRGKFGVGTSPVVDDNILVLVWDVAESEEMSSSIAAFDCATGRRLWQCERMSHPEFAAYGTPLIRSLNGEQAIIVHGWYDVKAYRLETGEELWSYAIIHKGEHLVASMTCDDEHLYVMGTEKVTSLDMAKLGTGEDPLVWFRSIPGEKSPTPVVGGGLMFLVTENGMACCLDCPTGELLWKKRLPGRYYSSVTMTADRVLFTNESGRTTVVAADRQFRELARNTLGESVYASMAPDGQRLYVRTFKNLYCLGKNQD